MSYFESWLVFEMIQQMKYLDEPVYTNSSFATFKCCFEYLSSQFSLLKSCYSLHEGRIEQGFSFMVVFEAKTKLGMEVTKLDLKVT